MSLERCFKDSLYFGKIGEDQISMIFRERGWGVIPVYEKTMDDGKGPRVFLKKGEESLIAPDMQVFKDKWVLWVEVKRKSSFSWSTRDLVWRTGIDKRHFDDYIEVNQKTPWKVHLFFIHDSEYCSNAPRGKKSPTGIFYNSIDYLKDNISFASKSPKTLDYGKTGMVYWDVSNLKRLSPIKEEFF